MPDTDAPELRDCPFCGKTAAVRGDMEDGGFYVTCLGPDCFCCVGEGYDRSAMPDHSFSSPELAIAAWNRRANPSPRALNADAPELLPCPFCGSAVMPRHALWPSEGDTDAVIHAVPTDCGLIDFNINTADEGISVAAAWNRRANPATDAGARQATALGQKDERIRVLTERLTRLVNEVSGTLTGIGEATLRHEVGNTNVNVLILRVEEARAAIGGEG